MAAGAAGRGTDTSDTWEKPKDQGLCFTAVPQPKRTASSPSEECVEGIVGDENAVGELRYPRQHEKELERINQFQRL